MPKKLGEKRTGTKTMTTLFSRGSELRKNHLQTLLKIHKLIKRNRRKKQCSTPKTVLQLGKPQKLKEQQQQQEVKARKEVQINNNKNRNKSQKKK